MDELKQLKLEVSCCNYCPVIIWREEGSVCGHIAAPPLFSEDMIVLGKAKSGTDVHPRCPLRAGKGMVVSRNILLHFEPTQELSRENKMDILTNRQATALWQVYRKCEFVREESLAEIRQMGLIEDLSLTTEGMCVLARTMPPIEFNTSTGNTEMNFETADSVSDGARVLYGIHWVTEISEWNEKPFRSIRDGIELVPDRSDLIGDIVWERTDLDRLVMFMDCWGGEVSKLEEIPEDVCCLLDFWTLMCRHKRGRIGDQVLNLKGTTNYEAMTRTIQKRLPKGVTDEIDR